MGSAAKEPSDPVVLAWEELDAAIRELTDTLEFEWDGEFRQEIEALNGAYFRYLVAKRKEAQAQ